MKTLHVRNVPDRLYKRLRARADARGTSISAEVIDLLGRTLRHDKAAVRKFLDDVERHPLEPGPGAPSPAELIREDRDQR